MGQSRVSVLMCTFNGEKYISSQIESILCQTYPIYELLIQDDLSEDSTKDIILKYAEEYPNIHYMANSHRLGPHANFLDILSKASGDYIAISDQDDIWEPCKIERLMNAIEDCSLVFGLSQSFGDGVEHDPEVRIPNVNTLRLMFYPVIPGHSMLFKREIYNLIPLGCSYKIYDLLIALSASINGSIVTVPEILTHHRRHQNAYSYTKPKDYSHTFINITRYTMKGIVGFFRKKERIKNHFSKMNTLLSEFSVSEDNSINGDAFRFTLYMSKCDMISIVRASKICFRWRNCIFYAKTKDNLQLKIRSILWPLLCSEYY